MKFLVALISVLWSSSVQAQSREELLPICIERSQEIITYAQAFRSGASSFGATMRPRDFVSIISNSEENVFLKELLVKSIAADADPKKIELELESGFARLETKKRLISDMLEEAFEESPEFEKLSLFISGCANAFGDEVYTLQEENDKLSEGLKTALSLQAASEQALEDLQKWLVLQKIKPPSRQSSLIDDAFAAALGQATETPSALSGPPLSTGEKDALRVAVQECWAVGSLSSLALETTVVVAVSFTQDGKPVLSSIRQVDSEGGTSASVKQAFETARRAIIRCGARGFDLPSDEYDQWKDFEMTFDPKGIRIK
tara:strand:+ start:67 stop:1014 length:948 start_codon:yes stop_codon:yes gene_type:complete